MIVLGPDFAGAKLYSRWQGPGTIIEVKSPYSYVVEIEGKKRHIHVNKIRKFNERLEQAMVNNCAVIFDKDDDFGAVQVIESQTTLPESAPSSRIEPSKVAHLTETGKRQLFAVLDKFPEVFSDKSGYCPLIEHEIKISPDFKPKRLRAYRVPELLKPEVER